MDINYCKVDLMNHLVASGFSHDRDTFQSESKLYIVINIDTDQYDTALMIGQS